MGFQAKSVASASYLQLAHDSSVLQLIWVVKKVEKERVSFSEASSHSACFNLRWLIC
jgi:hypothetical protein